MVITPKYACQQFLDNIIPFKINGIELDFCNEFKYLSHWLVNDLSGVKEMKREMRALYARVNNLIGCFYVCSVNVKCLLWRTFFKCLYGVGLWKLDGMRERMYTVAYNNYVKRFFGRSKYCLKRVMYGWVGLPTPGTLIHNARINAYKNIVICASHNELVGAFYSF